MQPNVVHSDGSLSDRSTALSFLAGGGEMGRLIREHDWASTQLGPTDAWPQSLRTAVRIMLTSRQPIWIGWGEDLTYLYNEAYRSIIGGKHPWALGRPTREVWSEIWTDIDPLLQTAMRGVEGTYVEEQLLIMERNGYAEETYYTFSYSPIPDDIGEPGGIICANTDDTERVMSKRQLGLLRQVAAGTIDARSWREACERSVQAMASADKDLTFVLLYARDDDSQDFLLAASNGFSSAALTEQETIPAQASAPWPLGEAVKAKSLLVVEDPQARLSSSLPFGQWDRPSQSAAVVPVPGKFDAKRDLVLVVGLNPYRLIDDGYREFLDQLAAQISGAVANADAYEAERRRSEALAELDRAKTVFFSNVSHEFRTPLTLMLGPLEEALGGDLSADVRNSVEVAHRNGVRLLRLVNSLLDFSRIEAGRVRASFAPTDLGAFTSEVASSFRSAIENAGVELVVEPAQLPGPAYVDRDMWEKILLNLLSNAFKFTLEGAIRVSVKPSSDGGSVVVAVADTGVGIPQAELPKLFERFHRIENQKGRSFEGSGIGLALVQELVKLHGAQIAVCSTEGQGSTFSITLPLGKAHLPPDQILEDACDAAASDRALEYVEEALRWTPDGPVAAGPALGPADLPVIGGQARILLADDNADMRGYVSKLLGASWTVETAEDGLIAWDKIRASPPDLVLTDVMMPGLDGFGLLRAIRGDPGLRDLPVIVISARAGEEARIEGLASGADDYLTKPFTARELVARVGSNLQLAAIRKDSRAAIEQRVAQFESLLNQAPIGVYLIDSDLRIREVNPIALRVFAGVEDLIGRDFEEVMHILWSKDYADEVVRIFRHCLATGEPHYSPERAEQRQDLGVTEYYEGLVSRIPLPEGGFGAVCYFRDISLQVQARQVIADSEERLRELNTRLEERVADEVAERSKAEEALRQAQKMEAVGQLTGGVAHDFNNLLTVIMGGLDTIRRSKPGDEARISRAADMAFLGAQRAASLTARLLAFSRRQPLEPKPLDLNTLVRDTTDLLHRTLGEQIELEGVLTPRLWTVEVDQNQLENALLNLALNARDAMPDGGKLTIETNNTELDEAYVSTDAEVIPGQYVAISVSDTGRGMSADTMARAFEPFFTTKGVGEGTGLGLSMIYGFVKQSNGHVTIYSEEGQGTTVKLYFPRFHGPSQAAAAADMKSTPRASEGEVVLIVEDNDDVRSYSAMILSELGYRVLQATNGQEALSIIQSDQPIDLLFTDVVLPGMSGKAVADRAAALRPGLKTLFTTGYSRNAIVHHGRLDPGVQLISKPFTFDQLAGRVRDLLDR
jgi:PAS domain S-box-containing protein